MRLIFPHFHFIEKCSQFSLKLTFARTVPEVLLQTLCTHKYIWPLSSIFDMYRDHRSKSTLRAPLHETFYKKCLTHKHKPYNKWINNIYICAMNNFILILIPLIPSFIFSVSSLHVIYFNLNHISEVIDTYSCEWRVPYFKGRNTVKLSVTFTAHISIYTCTGSHIATERETL